MSTELDRICELADRLADRALRAIERGELTPEQFRNSPDVALLLQCLPLSSVFEPSPQAQVRLPEQPPAPDIHDNRSGPLIQDECSGSLIEILRGNTNPGVPRALQFRVWLRAAEL